MKPFLYFRLYLIYVMGAVHDHGQREGPSPAGETAVASGTGIGNVSVSVNRRMRRKAVKSTSGKAFLDIKRGLFFPLRKVSE